MTKTTAERSGGAVITMGEGAAMLGITVNTLRHRLRRGAIPPELALQATYGRYSGLHREQFEAWVALYGGAPAESIDALRQEVAVLTAGHDELERRLAAQVARNDEQQSTCQRLLAERDATLREMDRLRSQFEVEVGRRVTKAEQTWGLRRNPSEG